jgi:hypothetical protein
MLVAARGNRRLKCIVLKKKKPHLCHWPPLLTRCCIALQWLVAFSRARRQIHFIKKKYQFNFHYSGLFALQWVWLFAEEFIFF